MDVPGAVLARLRDEHMLDGAETVVCALSGGADSVCLSHVLTGLAPSLGVKLECAHFNHRLRGAESDRDELFVRSWCAQRGLKLHTGSGDAAAFAEENHMGIEEAARSLRYAFLESLGDEKTRIATAHQADDQAETLLLHLVRGSGLRGLCGIPSVRGRIIRPLLSVSRADVLAYLADNGLTYVEDSTNALPDHTRNRLRHEVMPVLRELNPSFAETAGRTVKLLRDDEAQLHALAADAVDLRSGRAVLSAAELQRLPAPLASRAVLSAAAHFGVRLQEAHVRAVLRLAASANPSARADLPGELEARRRYDELSVGPREPSAGFRPIILPFDAWTVIRPLALRVFWGGRRETSKIYGKFTTFCFKKEQICGNICVRPREPGDELHPAGSVCGKSLKKWMIERRIPAAERALVPVFADQCGVLAVPGIGEDRRAAALPEEADAFLILERIPT